MKYGFGTDLNITGVSFSVFGQTAVALFRHGRLEEQTDLMGGRTKYEYNDNGRLSTVVDPNGSATRYSYGEGDLLIGVSLPNGQKLKYIYDPKRRMLQINEARPN